MPDLEQPDADLIVSLTDGDGEYSKFDMDTDDSNSRKLSTFTKIKGKLGNVISAIQDTALSIYRLAVDTVIRGKTGNVVDSITDGSVERLAVDSKVTDIALSRAQLNENFRIDLGNYNQTISSGVGGTTIYSLTGPGRAMELVFHMEDYDGFFYQIEVDGTIITMDDGVQGWQSLRETLESSYLYMTNSDRQFPRLGPWGYADSGVALEWSANGGIHYDSTFVVKLRSTSGKKLRMSRMSYVTD